MDTRQNPATDDPFVSRIRGVACVMVVLLHVSAQYFSSFSIDWWAANVFDSLVRCSVPLFFMLSGALLLPRVESVRGTITKRLLKIVPPLIFWSVLYVLLDSSRQIQFARFIPILQGPVKYHLWFLYVMVGLYLFLPFLSRMYRNCSHGEVKFFLVACFLAGSVLPTLQSYYSAPWSIVNAYYLNPFAGYVGFFVLGAFLKTHGDKTPSAAYGAIWAAVFLILGGVTATLTAILSHVRGTPQEFFFTATSPVVVLSAAAAFVGLHRLPLGTQGWFPRWIRRISDRSLGIYCVHVAVIEQLVPLISRYRNELSAWLWIPLLALVVLAVSHAICEILFRIPKLRAVV